MELRFFCFTNSPFIQILILLLNAPRVIYRFGCIIFSSTLSFIRPFSPLPAEGLKNRLSVSFLPLAFPALACKRA